MELSGGYCPPHCKGMGFGKAFFSQGDGFWILKGGALPKNKKKKPSLKPKKPPTVKKKKKISPPPPTGVGYRGEKQKIATLNFV